MNIDGNVIKRLQDWYASMCNGDWEHTYGVSISNIDNPGWELKVELNDTFLFGVHFKELTIQREHEDDWVVCRIEEGNFHGYGGPGNLGELLRLFLDWAEENAGSDP